MPRSKKYKEAEKRAKANNEKITKKNEKAKKVVNKKKDKKEDKQEGKKESKSLKSVENDLSINDTLDAIKKEIKSETSLPETQMKKIYKSVFINVLFGILFLVYFCLINAGYGLINPKSFFSGLQVLSIVSILFTIILFEIAYKKNSDSLAVRSIELLMLSIATLVSLYFYTIYNNRFTGFMTSFGLLFAVYFVGKSIYKYIKDRRQMKMEIIDNEKKEEMG